MRLTLVPSKPPLSIDSPFGYIPGPVMPPSPPSFFTGRILAEDGSTGTGTPTTYSANLPPLSTSLTQELLQNYVMEHNAQVSCLSTNIMAAAGPGYFPACSSRLMFPPPPPQPPRPTITLPPLTLEELLASPIVSPVGEEPQPSGSLPVSEHGVIYPGQVLPPTQAPTQVEGQQHGSMVRNQSMDTIISSAVTPSSLITGSYPAAGIEPPPCPRVNLLGEAVPHGSTHMLQGTAGMTNPIVPFMTQPISGLPVDPLMLNFSGPPICAPPPEPVPMPPCPSPSIYGGLSPLKRGDSADLQQLYAAFMNEEEILMPFTEGAGQQPLSPGGAAVAGQQTGVKRQTRESTPPSPRSHRLRNKKRAVEESVGPKTPDNGAQAVGVVETAAAAASLAEGKTSGAAERSRSKAVNVPGHTKALLFVKDKAGDKEILREVQCEHLFGKVVTSTDCGRLARIVLPRAEVERFFPPCDNRNGVGITLWDTCGTFKLFKIQQIVCNLLLNCRYRCLKAIAL